MSLVLLGRAGETKVVTNLGAEVVIRVIEVRDGRVLLDVSTINPEKDYTTCELPLFLRKQAD